MGDAPAVETAEAGDQAGNGGVKVDTMSPPLMRKTTALTGGQPDQLQRSLSQDSQTSSIGRSPSVTSVRSVRSTRSSKGGGSRRGSIRGSSPRRRGSLTQEDKVMTFDEFKRLRSQGQEDPHAQAKAKIAKQVNSVYMQKRNERLKALEFFVSRAFELAKSTGEVVIGRDRDELADDGMKHVTSSLSDHVSGRYITGLNISSHRIGPLGATQLAEALMGAPRLVTVNMGNNVFGSQGADVLARTFTGISTLENLDLSENQIGPGFPPNLVHCRSLKTLDLIHNKLTSIPCSLGMHPNLELLDLGYNSLQDCLDESLIRAGCVPILREMVDRDMAETCERGKHNQFLGPITGVAPDQVVLPGEKNYCYPLREIEIVVDERWHDDDEWLASLLEKHTTLRALNGLHEWPTPPLAETATWDLDGALQHPLYEAVFVRNCMWSSDALTSINISNNDLCGRAALALAQAIERSHTLTSIDVSGCRWDDGMQVFADAVRMCSTVQRLNLLSLADDAVTWDLRGRLNSVIDVAFVTSRLESQGARLVSLDLSCNTLSSREGQLLARATRHAPHLTFLNGLWLADNQTKWDLRRRVLDGRASDEGERTYGTTPIEFEFLNTRLSQVFILTDIDLSGNALGDAAMPMVRDVLKQVVKSLHSLTLNHNAITKASCGVIKESVLSLTKLKMLRVCENFIETEGAKVIVEAFSEGPHRLVSELHLDEAGIGPLVPEGISAIFSLQVLSLRYNKLKVLATDLCELPRLRALLVDGNPIEIPQPVIARRGFNAIMQFLQAAHRLTPLRRQHLDSLQEDVPRDIRPHILDVAQPLPGSQLSKRTMADRHRHVYEIARSSVLALEVDERGDGASSVGGSSNQDGGAMDKPTKTVLVSQLQRHGRGVNSAVGHADRKVFATCSDDGSVKIWEPSEIDEERWTCSSTLSGHAEAALSVSFSPRGLPLMLASGSRDATVRLWIPDTDDKGRQVWACGQVLGNAHERAKMRRKNKKVRLTGHREPVRAVSFRRIGDENLLASASDDETIRIWGLRTQYADVSEEEAGTSDEEDAEEFSEEKLLRQMQTDELRRIFNCFCCQTDPDDPEAQQQGAEPPTADPKAGNPAQGAAVGRTGSAAQTADPPSPNKRAQPGKAGKKFGALGERGQTMDMAELMSFYRYSGMNQCVAKSVVTHMFKLVNAKHDYSPTDTHELDWEEFCEILFLVGNKTTFDVEGQRKLVGKCQWTEYGTLESVCGVEVKYLGTSKDAEQEERTIDWACLETLKGHTGPVTCLAWLPGASDLLASGSFDEHIMVWNNTISRGRSIWTKVFRASAHADVVSSMCFGRNLRQQILLASASADKTVMMWRVNIRQVQRETLDGPVMANAYLFSKGERLSVPGGATPRCCAFREDAMLMAVACDDNTVQLYGESEEGNNWKPVDVVRRHAQSVHWVAFGGGGKRPMLMVSCSGDGCAKLHDTEPVTRWGVKGSMEPVRRGFGQGQIQFPTRSEGQTFHRKPQSNWKFEVPEETMADILASLESPVLALRRDIEIQPNHGGSIVVPCQEGATTHSIRVDYAPKTVWNRVSLTVSAINISQEAAFTFEDCQLVSPVVDFGPHRTMFRQSVKVHVPHNSATYQELTMVYYSFGAWHSVENYRVTPTHAIATIESFEGPMTVVFTGDESPVDLAYALPLTLDGRPLEDSTLTLGVPIQAQIECIPCASVQKSIALSDAFRDMLKSVAAYKMTRGASVSAVDVQMLAALRGYTLECTLTKGAQWDGSYALLRVSVTAVAPGDVEGGPLGGGGAVKGGGRPRTTGAQMIGGLPPHHLVAGASSPNLLPAARSAIATPPPTRSGLRSSGSGESLRGILARKEELFMGFTVHFERGQEPAMVRPIRVSVQAMRLSVKMAWGGGAAGAAAQVTVRTLVVDKVMSLWQVRGQIFDELRFDGLGLPDVQARILRRLWPLMFFKTHEGKRVPHDDEAYTRAYQFCPHITLYEAVEYESRATTPATPAWKVLPPPSHSPVRGAWSQRSKTASPSPGKRPVTVGGPGAPRVRTAFPLGQGHRALGKVRVAHPDMGSENQ